MTALEFEPRVCPICGTADRSQVFAEPHFDQSRLNEMSFSSRKTPERMYLRLLECATCDLVYASPVPSAESLNAAYRGAHYDSTVEARYAAETYARVLATLSPDLPKVGGAVDIGAGDGAFLERLRAAGFEPIVGFEPSAAPRAAASAEIQAAIRPEPFVAGALPADAFGLVTCLQTIEHVPDPLGLCREAARALAPGGTMMIVCHDRRALSARLLKRRSPIFDIEHVQLFSPASIRELLNRTGFERITVRSISNRYPLGYWLRLTPLPSGLGRLLQRTLSGLQLTRVALTVRAGNIAAIGYKPKS